MNREDIIRMAREADRREPSVSRNRRWVECFAALVAAAEREACAKLVEDKFDFCGDELIAAAAIRKRGEVKP